MSNRIAIAESHRASETFTAAPVEGFRTADEIKALVRAFEDTTLPRAEWTHRAHLTVALWYLTQHSGREATARIRTGIKRYNAAKGVLTTPTGGYHETLTLFWICMISHFLLFADVSGSLVELTNAMLARIADKDLPLRYYSRERLMSPQARASWVEPDLQPLV
jgi:hypothetical protein